MSSKTDEVKLDIEELNSLLEQARRQRTKDILMLEIRRLQTELARLLEENKNAAIKPTTPLFNGPKKCYEVKLNNYGWDQTLTTVKIYITLKDVHQLPKQAIICNFTDKSLDLRVLGLDKKNYNLPINNLCAEIDTERSSFKVKTDMIVVLLAKKVAKDWSHITLVEKRIKDAKSSVPELGEDSDPSASLMNLMKKMYQDGDDEMKKTIAKAWTESQEKQRSGTMDL
ncbi:Calcyclin-binding protein [Camponotus floridanus]|uniref:Calcyclin-binding protein n=1 Tax=Camponotus floridanus TaxID=104421 RepID=E2AA03_CAMFO|nr:calcyclin-binding protein [Camponotus floridanus]EFN69732.1 Calcyclin-binding protein [Camponotus floridanus]